MNRKAALASQTGNQRSRVALRRMVADALERNILDEFKSSEFERNPLIDAEPEEEHRSRLRLAQKSTCTRAY